jgi:transposase
MSDDKYIAFDVHQAATVASVLNAAGREVNTGIVPTQAQPLIGFLQGLGGKLHLTCEEGTYAAWLYDLLQGRVAELVVCDPRHNALLKEGNKTDAGDARKLAELLRAGMLRAVYHGNRSMRARQELAHCYEALRDDTTRVMNRIKAFYHGRGIDCAGRGVYARGQRASWLERLPAGASRLRGELLHDQLDHVRSLRKKARQALLQESRKHTVAARLGKIPGLGPLRVALLMAHVQTPHRFRSARNLWTYAGLGLVRRGSAEYQLVEGRVVRRAKAVNPRGLNPNHRPELKEIFKSAALTAIRRPGPFKDYYDPRAQRGVDPAILRVTVARKLAALILSLWKKGGHYRAEGVKPQA